MKYHVIDLLSQILTLIKNFRQNVIFKVNIRENIENTPTISHNIKNTTRDKKKKKNKRLNKYIIEKPLKLQII